ncbi:phage holin family protein [Paracoccus sp. 11-3]|uniref:Phage holin family protein n=1 Tax=Paracoccus amoyensis TaxID=2760093 RepID=A0A926GEM2_9RHOB|nr:phage holin family protein [Paracoccus amoyensis]MBC9245944.1 phage holin family protein [Paracoccus amoyensis]
MFDYAQRLQLALTDTARRTGMKVAAGLIAVVGAGFLVAALWSWLAYHLDWGPMLASLAVGGGFLVLALIVFATSNRTRHRMPTTDDLKQEVETRLTLAADAAANRARNEASRVLDMAGNKVTSLMDDASYRANKLASDAEQRVYGVAQSVGLTSENIDRTKAKAAEVKQKVAEASNSNAGSMLKLLGAFAIGVTMAAKLREARNDDDHYDEDDFV